MRGSRRFVVDPGKGRGKAQSAGMLAKSVSVLRRLHAVAIVAVEAF